MLSYHNYQQEANKKKYRCTTYIILSFHYIYTISDAANKLGNELLHFTELYNSALDHIDLMRDYYNWQSFGPFECFSYCQYPFILSIVAKRIILTKDSEQQMILNARKSLVTKVARRQTPNIDIFFLNINVRRSHLVQDSLNEVRKY